MITSRRKKGDQPKTKLVPTELPVFSELERRGWVVMTSEKPKVPARPRMKPKR